MVTRIKLIALVLLVVFQGFSQELACGTSAPTLEQQERLKELIQLEGVFDKRIAVEVTEIAIVAHVIRQSDGTGGITAEELDAALDNVNNFYSNANMAFFYLDIRYIDEDRYYNFVTSDEGLMTSEHNYDGVINIYFTNEVSNGEGSYYCGYAYFPGGADVILMNNACTVNGSTLPHEIGHFFFLYHTHGTTNNGTTDEVVIRPGEESVACVEPDCSPIPSNCDTNGDRLCDTEADPNVSGKVDVDCSYTEDETDANGDSFRPDPTNIMSYSTKPCRDVFSNGQYDRMQNAFLNNRNYLHTESLLSAFTASDKEICKGESINFNDRSINALSYEWSFEGGNPSTSSDPNPEIFYETSGSYDVTLTITDSEGNTDTKTLNEVVSVREDISSEVTTIAGSFESEEIEEKVIAGGNNTWTHYDVATDGTKSVYVFLYQGDNGDGNYLVLNPLKTDVEKTFSLTFDYAYAAVEDTNEDRLEIVYRDPCGDWQIAWSKAGQELATAPNEATVFFVPSADHWVSETFTFQIDEEIEVAEIAFRTVSDNGNAIYVDNYNIETFDASFTITEVVTTNSSCPDSNDGAIEISVSTTDDFEYSLDGETFISANTFENILPGTYTIIVRNFASEETIEVEVVSENDYPNTPVIELTGGGLSVSTTEGQVVQWYFNEVIVEGANESLYEFENVGSYQVSVSNGACTSLSDPFVVLSADIIELELEIYPNPVEDEISFKLSLELQKEVNRITIGDLSGRQVKVFGNTERLDVSSLKSGLYILQFELDGEKVSRRFLKQ